MSDVDGAPCSAVAWRSFPMSIALFNESTALAKLLLHFVTCGSRHHENTSIAWACALHGRCRHGFGRQWRGPWSPSRCRTREGLQREPGTIFASGTLRVGDDYNDEKGAAAIRALFGLGLSRTPG